MYPPTVKWLLYPDDEDETENNGKISEDGLSMISVEDQKKDTLNQPQVERFIDLTIDEEAIPNKILKKRRLHERLNAEDIEASEESYKLRRKPEHSFTPNIPWELVAKKMKKVMSHDEPIQNTQ